MIEQSKGINTSHSPEQECYYYQKNPTITQLVKEILAETIVTGVPKVFKAGLIGAFVGTIYAIFFHKPLSSSDEIVPYNVHLSEDSSLKFCQTLSNSFIFSLSLTLFISFVVLSSIFCRASCREIKKLI